MTPPTDHDPPCALDHRTATAIAIEIERACAEVARDYATAGHDPRAVRAEVGLAAGRVCAREHGRMTPVSTAAADPEPQGGNGVDPETPEWLRNVVRRAEEAVSDEVNTLLDEFALMLMEYHDRVAARLRAMEDDRIEELIRQAEAADATGVATFGDILRQARGERGYRVHLARARALDCDVYCVHHASDARACAHLHGDDESTRTPIPRRETPMAGGVPRADNPNASYWYGRWKEEKSRADRNENFRGLYDAERASHDEFRKRTSVRVNALEAVQSRAAEHCRDMPGKCWCGAHGPSDLMGARATAAEERDALRERVAELQRPCKTCDGDGVMWVSPDGGGPADEVPEACAECDGTGRGWIVQERERAVAEETTRCLEIAHSHYRHDTRTGCAMGVCEHPAHRVAAYIAGSIVSGSGSRGARS